MKCRVTHLINGLGKGGAETMLYQIVKYKSNPEIEYKVISLGKGDYFEKPLQDLGCEVLTIPIGKRPIKAFFQLVRELSNVDVLSCWLYHSNLIGYYAGRITRVPKIIWSIRHSDLSPELNKKTTLYVNKLCARHSSNITKVLYNGEKAYEVHKKCGYRASSKVIINGCDCDIYAPCIASRAQICSQLGILQDERIVLSVSKNTRIKDVPTFIKAYCLVKETLPETKAIICGNGIDANNKEIVAICKELGLTINKDIYLLGLRDDVNLLMQACDVYVLHSISEAFPNTLIQAMASGCLCVTTDAGDSRIILNKEEYVAPVKNPTEIAKKVVSLLELNEQDKCTIGSDNRKRAIERYNILKVVKEYEGAYLDV